MKNILKSLIILLILTTGETELRSINFISINFIEEACQALNGTWAVDSCQNITEGQCINKLQGYWDKVRNMCFVSREAAQQACSQKKRYWADGGCYQTQEEACQALNGTWAVDSCQYITEGECTNNLKGYWADGGCYQTQEEAKKVEQAKNRCAAWGGHWANGQCSS